MKEEPASEKKIEFKKIEEDESPREPSRQEEIQDRLVQ